MKVWAVYDYSEPGEPDLYDNQESAVTHAEIEGLEVSEVEVKSAYEAEIVWTTSFAIVGRFSSDGVRAEVHPSPPYRSRGFRGKPVELREQEQWNSGGSYTCHVYGPTEQSVVEARDRKIEEMKQAFGIS